MQKSNMIAFRSLLLAVLPVLLAAAPAPDSQDRATPDGNPGVWLTDADYPLDAQRAEQEGVVAFELAIDVRGVPTRCTVTTSSGAPSLDNATCAKLMERARFKPAHNAAGKAIADTYTGRITWRLPDVGTGMLPPLPTTTIMTFYVEPDGMATNCRITVNGQPSPDLSQCSNQILGRRYPIQRDAAGTPTRQKIRITLGFEKVDEDK